MDKETNTAIASLRAEIWILRTQVMAYRIGLQSLARTHHDPKRLYADFDKAVETAIAKFLQEAAPEPLVDTAQRELEVMRDFLRSIVQEQDQGK
jgi:hypothetical protein